MKRTIHTIPFAAVLFVSGACIGPVAADLPNLPDKPWQDYFAAFESRKFTFTLDPWGQGKLTPVGDSGKVAGHSLLVPVTFVVEEVLPGGKTSAKQIDHDTVETKDKPFLKQGKATFRGKVTGGASFEGVVEVDKGTIQLGGRLLDPGTLTKNPLRLGIRVVFPSLYRNTKKSEKDDIKAFAKKLKDDRYTLVWTDGKRAKFEGGAKIDPESKAVNGPGIAEFRVDAAAYQGRAFEFKAGTNAKMLVWARQEQEFHEGTTITWYPDPAKDPEGKARLTIDIR